MTSNSGINPQLLTVTGLGYNGATNGNYAGMFFWEQCNQTVCKDPADQSLEFGECEPAGDTSCLLPTYYDTANDPYNAQSSNSGTPTGFFDYNQGQLITNQQGDSNFPNYGTDTSYWVNEWYNHAAYWCYAKGECDNGVVPIIDNDGGYSGSAAFSPEGRPVLFDPGVGMRQRLHQPRWNLGADTRRWSPLAVGVRRPLRATVATRRSRGAPWALSRLCLPVRRPRRSRRASARSDTRT
jgi:hypothetical protein